MRSFAGSWAASTFSEDGVIAVRSQTRSIGDRSTQSGMETVPIPEVLPFVEPLSKVGRFCIGGRPEFLEFGTLGPHNLAVEMR
jgi:hypothetical protein